MFGLEDYEIYIIIYVILGGFLIITQDYIVNPYIIDPIKRTAWYKKRQIEKKQKEEEKKRRYLEQFSFTCGSIIPNKPKPERLIQRNSKIMKNLMTLTDVLMLANRQKEIDGRGGCKKTFNYAECRPISYTHQLPAFDPNCGTCGGRGVYSVHIDEFDDYGNLIEGLFVEKAYACECNEVRNIYCKDCYIAVTSPQKTQTAEP